MREANWARWALFLFRHKLFSVCLCLLNWSILLFVWWNGRRRWRSGRNGTGKRRRREEKKRRRRRRRRAGQRTWRWSSTFTAMAAHSRSAGSSEGSKVKPSFPFPSFLRQEKIFWVRSDAIPYSLIPAVKVDSSLYSFGRFFQSWCPTFELKLHELRES